ncbi:MAG: NAD(P)H-hydrate epimerase [Candidatus Marinimicrobia bacterium]|nr:NAD(P)H-hydrate epimerase [Candidatus Neomarinimicrobiota bacterium]
MADIFLPAITVEQMREVDRLMVEEYHITLPQMMEHAGRNLADFSLEWLKKRNSNKTQFNIVVACGTGNNGGGGMVTARFLVNKGHDIIVVLTGHSEKLKPVPANHWKTLKAMGVQTIEANSTDSIPVYTNSDLIIDAVVGYSLKGELRGVPARVVRDIMQSGKEDVISLDVPSGLDATSGEASPMCIKAVATMTLALPKTGLVVENAKECTGDVYLADIGVPPSLYSNLGLSVDPFKSDSVVSI